MLHRLRHETNNNLTFPFREIERKHKSNEISLYILWCKKMKPKRKSYETSQSGFCFLLFLFLTFVFKESFHDLSLFLKVQSFWRNNSSAWTSYCEIARTFTLGQVISVFFLQLRSRGWGFNQFSPISPQRGLVGFNHVRSRFGGFLHFNSRGTPVCHPNFFAWF